MMRDASNNSQRDQATFGPPMIHSNTKSNESQDAKTPDVGTNNQETTTNTSCNNLTSATSNSTIKLHFVHFITNNGKIHKDNNKNIQNKKLNQKEFHMSFSQS